MPRAAGIALVASVSLACGPSAPERPDAAGLGPSGATCPTDSTLSYESFGRAFMDDYCQPCHAASVLGPDRQGAPSSHPFDTPAQIRADAAAIDRLTAAGPDRVNTDMPRAFPLPSDAERFALGQWLACGAP